jgi:hypothetical protein
VSAAAFLHKKKTKKKQFFCLNHTGSRATRILSTRQKTIFIYVMIGGCIARTDVRIVRPASLRVASTNAI